ncbi:MAG: hypothetical protein IPI97_06790 [Nitrosomonas sp.]|nr:hypothetical protein [Nitrosomonas sp.]
MLSIVALPNPLRSKAGHFVCISLCFITTKETAFIPELQKSPSQYKAETTKSSQLRHPALLGPGQNHPKTSALTSLKTKLNM